MPHATRNAFFPDALDPERYKLFLRLKRFTPRGILGGGTAAALQLRHRRSYDLDVFLPRSVPRGLLLWLRRARLGLLQPLVDSGDELTVLAQDIRVSFISFPFLPLHPTVRTPSLPLYALRDLASNKAYAIGRRGVYRDYVDLYFLLRRGIPLATVIREAEQRFTGAFSEKLFLEQLTYFADLEETPVDYLAKDPPTRRTLQRFFEDLVTTHVRRLTGAAR